MSQKAYDYDIVMMSDFRYPGGTSSSQVEEIRAQAAAGYRTGLLHVPSPRLRNERPFHQGIADCVDAGLAEPIIARGQLRTRLLLVRHPVVLSRALDLGCTLDADVQLVVANQPPRDSKPGPPVYDVRAVHRQAVALLGEGVRWAPIGPLVRDAILAEWSDLPVLEYDWFNVIDPAEWSVERSGSPRRRPVIGRHSRPDFRKWPTDRAEILAAYPPSGDVEVRVLGGADPVQDLVGRIPEGWIVHPFDAMPARDFLQTVDFYVYFHHPEWIEAFGRAILEAMATGAVCILPSHFERLFGAGCLYASPDQVMDIVRRLRNDPAAYRRQSDAALRVVQDRFSHDAHVMRLGQLIGRAKGDPRRAPRPVTRPSRTVLFMSSNGTGVGHLTRLMAMARRCSPDVRPVFLTLSHAVQAVRDAGFLVEYFPSAKTLGSSPADWNPHLARRLSEAIRTHRADAVVFDGTMPYGGLLEARKLHPEIPFIWSRRAMWKPGVPDTALGRARHFDLVLQPGELSVEADRTPPIPGRVPVKTVPPIVFGRQDELLDRAEARTRLGIPEKATAVLVQLGSGNNQDLPAHLRRLLPLLSEISGVHVCLAESPIAERALTDEGPVHPLRLYPLHPYYRAFDFAVSAAGYNSFHELIAFAVPSLFLPNPAMPTDDQVSRARQAEAMGTALCVDDLDGSRLRWAVRQLAQPHERKQLRERCQAVGWENGAMAAMRTIESWAGQSRPAPTRRPSFSAPASLRRLSRQLLTDELARGKAATASPYGASAPTGSLRVPGRRTLTRWVGKLQRASSLLLDDGPPPLPVPPGCHLHHARHASPEVLAFVWLGHGRHETQAMIERVIRSQIVRRDFVPLFVVDEPLQPDLRRQGMVCEYIVPRSEWTRLASTVWHRYVMDRLSFIQRMYAPRAILLAPGDESDVAKALGLPR
jgi:UDP:flavonoid glycosyltransferase YjiC (YdhE family)